MERGSNFGQRSEDEASEMHAGMGGLEFRQINGLVAVQKNVQINEARTFGKFFLAAPL